MVLFLDKVLNDSLFMDLFHKVDLSGLGLALTAAFIPNFYFSRFENIEGSLLIRFNVLLESWGFIGMLRFVGRTFFID